MANLVWCSITALRVIGYTHWCYRGAQRRQHQGRAGVWALTTSWINSAHTARERQITDSYLIWWNRLREQAWFTLASQCIWFSIWRVQIDALQVWLWGKRAGKKKLNILSKCFLIVCVSALLTNNAYAGICLPLHVQSTPFACNTQQHRLLFYNASNDQKWRIRDAHAHFSQSP